MGNDSTAKTLIVATLLCVVCSVLVSGAAVSLKPAQDLNKTLDIKKNLLLASGLATDVSKLTAKEVEEKFQVVETKVVDLSTGEYVEVDPESFDAVKAAKTPGQNYKIDSKQDIAHIKTRAKLSKVYLVKENNEVSMIVLPVNGKGLWSTLYGFLALAPDTTTVKGLGFYQHGETPGLGGEIDNPNWKKLWVGKKALDEAFEPVIKVIKGSVNPASANANSEIDGLSGATLTSNGVTGLVHYWLGNDAFGPFLAKFRATTSNGEGVQDEQN